MRNRHVELAFAFAAIGAFGACADPTEGPATPPAGSSSVGAGTGAQGGGGHGGGEQAPPQAWLDLAKAWSEWDCAKGLECYPNSGKYAVGTEAACIALRTEHRTRLWRADGPPVDAFEACFGVLLRDHSTCEAWRLYWGRGWASRDWPAACRLTGSRPTGALCEIAEQCVSSRCEGYVGVGSFCGLCAAPIEEGMPCMGTGCDYELACENGRCVTLGLEGDACDADIPCANTWCGAGKCDKHLALGDDCDPSLTAAPWRTVSFQCAWDTACNPNTMKCESAKPEARLGDPCWILPDGTLGLCQDGWCQIAATGEGTCIAKKQPGESCKIALGNDILGNDSDCAHPTLCIQGTCQYVGDIARCE